MEMSWTDIRFLSSDRRRYEETTDQSPTSFGVQVTFEDLWNAMAFIAFVWVLGFVSEKFLFLPSLVGQIFAGIIGGPQVLQMIMAPFDKTFVLLGEMGLVLFVLEAGVHMDFETLKLIGMRGIVIAVIGSIMPISIAFGITFGLVGNMKGAIAAAASFGPTSFGISMNILQSGGVIQSPIGQLVVAAAIMDDMIAIIVLSQLQALVGPVSIQSILIPIISSILFLVMGGCAALFLVPRFLDKFVFGNKMSEEKRGRRGLILMFVMLIGMMQATHSAKASHLMGAFLVGLVFCRNSPVQTLFTLQFKRVIQWLMRIFFASTIGFQVPIKEFSDVSVVGKGFLFSLALLGKVSVGLLVPNFTNHPRFTGSHLQDCAVVGCSMAAEGEFAFVIATFAVNGGIIDEKIYASVVLAILLSAVIAPLLLRLTLRAFHPEEKLNENNVDELDSNMQEDRNEKESLRMDTDVPLHSSKTHVAFLHIRVSSKGHWSTLSTIMGVCAHTHLEVIDCMSWCIGKSETTVVNELYVKLSSPLETSIDQHSKFIQDKIQDVLPKKIEDADVSITEWIPNAVHRNKIKVKDLEFVSSEIAAEARRQLEMRKALEDVP